MAASRLVLPARRLLTSTGAALATPKAPSLSPAPKLTTLKNGLRVATQETPFKTATYGLFVDAGSRFETPETNGTAHFLEHLAFKGTKKRTQYDLELEVERMGALMNAFTSREQTVYFMKAHTADSELVLDFLSDIMLNSQFHNEAVEMERKTILTEMKFVNYQKEELVLDNLHYVAFRDTPLGWPILGPEENVKRIMRKDLNDYIARYYRGPRMVFVASGGVRHDDMVALADRYFGALPAADIVPPYSKCPFQAGEYRMPDSEEPLAHIAIAVEGVGWSHPDYFNLMVAINLIGSFDINQGTGQRITSQLAKATLADGLAEKYMSYLTSYTDTGVLGIFATTPADALPMFVDEFRRTWRALEHATPEDVERARAQALAMLLFEVDGTTMNCLELGRHLLTYGKHLTLAEIAARVEAVTVEDVRNAVRKYMLNKPTAISSYGAIENFPTMSAFKDGI
eukprot:m.23921 g.23921  ORF g.23921 m.23921 type:complete len:457 (-) comp3949_c0_seq2:103-1473(-)